MCSLADLVIFVIINTADEYLIESDLSVLQPRTVVERIHTVRFRDSSAYYVRRLLRVGLSFGGRRVN